MKISRRLLFFVAIALLITSAALAQGVGTTSSLSGTVTSEGKPFPGVTVTIASPSLQGTRTTVTGEGGGYNFPSIPPGQYTVTFELEGMQRVTKKVLLAVATPSRADADMKLSSVKESITVTAAAPAVLETTEIARNFDQKQIAQLPVRRNIRDTVLLAPGVNANGPNNQVMISGAPSYDNLFLVNGVVVNENLRGQPHNLFIEDAIQEQTTLTGGISAEYGRFTGGVVSTLTKSGGNEYHGSLRDSMTNPNWIAENDFEKAANAVAGSDISKHPNTRSDIYEGTLGGFMLKDRLWFFGAGRHSKGAPANGFNAQVGGISGCNGKDASGKCIATFPGITFLNTNDENRYEGKLTGSITQKHSIVASYLNIKLTENNNVFPPIYDTASIVTQRELPNSLKAIAYNGVITSNILIEGQASQKKFAFVHSGGIFTDQIKGTWISDANARFNAPVFCGVCTNEERNNDLTSAKGHYYLNTKSLGNHDFVAGGELYKETRLVNNNQSASNFTISSTGTANFLPGDPTPYPHFTPGNTVINYRPILVTSTGDHFNTSGVFLNDKWDLNTRLSFNLGVRYDKNNVRDASGNVVSDDKAFSPRLGALWDIRGTGKDRVNLGYARYVSKITDGNAGGAGNAAGTPASFQWFYNGPAVNPVNSTGQIVGTPVAPQAALQILFNWFNALCDSQNRCGINNVGNLAASSYPGFTQRVLGPITSPYVDEITLGYGHQFGSNAYVKVDLVKRDWHDFYGLMVNSTTGSITAPNGAVNDLAVLVNEDSFLQRYYRAAQLQFSWRPLSRLNVGGGYTFSTLRGNDVSEADGTATSAQTASNIFYPEYTHFAQRAPVGYLTGDVKHRGRVWAGYDLPTPVGNLNLSIIQSADSGRAYSAIGAVDPTGTNANFKYVGAPTQLLGPYVPSPSNKLVPSQLSTSQNYYFSGRGAFRTASVFSSDLALNYELPIRRVSLFAQGQVVNIFNNSKIADLSNGRVDTTVLTSRSNGIAATGLSPFNPFTDTPIECPQGANSATCSSLHANWQLGPSFGKAVSKDALQTPRTYRLSFGVRF